MSTPTITYIAVYATGATALGTIGLAIATFVLAKRTKKLAESGQETADAANREIELIQDQVAAAQAQSKTAEDALGASIRPLVVDVPRPTWRRGPLRTTLNREGLGTTATQDVDLSEIRSEAASERQYLVVPIRNVGPGLALVTAALVTSTRGGERPVVPGNTPSVVAPGEVVSVRFTPESETEPGTLLHLLSLGDNLVVKVAYTDVAGRQPAASQLQLDWVNEGRIRGYFARGVDLLESPSSLGGDGSSAGPGDRHVGERDRFSAIGTPSALVTPAPWQSQCPSTNEQRNAWSRGWICPTRAARPPAMPRCPSELTSRFALLSFLEFKRWSSRQSAVTSSTWPLGWGSSRVGVGHGRADGAR